MIYVKRDPDLIPEKLIAVAQRAQERLEELPAGERIAFIKKKSHIWRAFKRHLRAMSYGKCWYSEAMGPQSPYDVDHFRPKSEAQRSDTEKDNGYPWLAFDWDNFRYSAERSNRLNKDEDTNELVGKSSWFPLGPGSPIATWDDRCIKTEKPMLLDPVNPEDMKLIVVDSNGRIGPGRACAGTDRQRVEWTIRCYGLNLPYLTDARCEAMRELDDQIGQLERCIDSAEIGGDLAADKLDLPKFCQSITARALPKSAYSLAALCHLMVRFPQLLPKNTDYEAMAA